MLKIKTMADLLPKFVFDVTNKTDKLTDFSVGSAIRTLAESACLQLEEFYFAMYQNIQYAIANSIYDAFGFSRRKAIPADGLVRIVFREPLKSSWTIPSGQVFTTTPSTMGARKFLTDRAYIAQIGDTDMTVKVVSEIAGVNSNIAFNTITVMQGYKAIVKEVYNPYSFTNGLDEESHEDRKTRFQHYIRTLSKGTRDAILYGALEVDGIQGAYVDDRYIGYVRVYVHDYGGNLSVELKQQVTANQRNYRAAGIEVDVWACEKVYIDFELEVFIKDQFNTEIYGKVIQDILIKKIDSYKVGSDFYASDVIAFVRWMYPDIVVDVHSRDLQDIDVPVEGIVRSGAVKVICKQVKDWRSLE